MDSFFVIPKGRLFFCGGGGEPSKMSLSQTRSQNRAWRARLRARGR